MKRRQILLHGTTALFATPALGSLFRALAQDASAATPLSRPRYVLYTNANGLQRQKVRESKWSAAGGFQLAGALAPLQKHASDLLVVESLFNNVSVYQHGNNSSALTCAKRGTNSGIGAAGGAPKIVGGISIDQVIAGQISRAGVDGVRVPALVMGNPVPVRGGDCTYGTLVGAGDNNPVFPITDPLKAFEQLFGSGKPSTDPAVLAKLAAQKSQLDHLIEEIKTVNATLPQSQREKLDLYLSSVRALEDELALRMKGDDSACVAPTKPATTQTSRVNNPALWKNFLDLGIAALRCGVTRQVTLLHSYGCIHYSYTFDGVTKNHHEQVAHQEEEGPFMTKILAWHATQVAYIYEQLQASGDADDTVVMWMSDGGGKHHNGNSSYPIIALGKPGQVVKTGKYVTYADGKVSLARFHLTMANAFGSPITQFGDGTDPGKDPLTELI